MKTIYLIASIFFGGLLLMLGTLLFAGDLPRLIPFANDIFIGFLAKAFLAFIGILGIRIVLYWFDRLAGIEFKEWFHGLPETTQGLYVSCRFISVALFFAIILV